MNNPSDSQLQRLREITHRLRAPGGCEWDRKQSYESLRQYAIEEVYEVVDAVDRGDFVDLEEELGDLLFQVYFYAEIAEEDGRFDLEDVARGIADKLVRRHPHVFEGLAVDGVGEILKNWEEIKAAEKAEKARKRAASRGEPEAAAAYAAEDTAARERDKTSRIPHETGRMLPALSRAEKIQKKASRAGFDWRERRDVIAKIREELDELEDALAADDDASHIEEELGDLLFAVVNLARHVKTAPETALNRANRKFIERFQTMEADAGERALSFEDLSEEELDALWNRAKEHLRNKVPASDRA